MKWSEYDEPWIDFLGGGLSRSLSFSWKINVSTLFFITFIKLSNLLRTKYSSSGPLELWPPVNNLHETFRVKRSNFTRKRKMNQCRWCKGFKVTSECWL
jgi:hypothetical protein